MARSYSPRKEVSSETLKFETPKFIDWFIFTPQIVSSNLVLLWREEGPSLHRPVNCCLCNNRLGRELTEAFGFKFALLHVGLKSERNLAKNQLNQNRTLLPLSHYFSSNQKGQRPQQRGWPTPFPKPPIQANARPNSIPDFQRTKVFSSGGVIWMLWILTEEVTRKRGSSISGRVVAEIGSP